MISRVRKKSKLWTAFGEGSNVGSFRLLRWPNIFHFLGVQSCSNILWHAYLLYCAKAAIACIIWLVQPLLNNQINVSATMRIMEKHEQNLVQYQATATFLLPFNPLSCRLSSIAGMLSQTRTMKCFRSPSNPRL